MQLFNWGIEILLGRIYASKGLEVIFTWIFQLQRLCFRIDEGKRPIGLSDDIEQLNVCSIVALILLLALSNGMLNEAHHEKLMESLSKLEGFPDWTEFWCEKQHRSNSNCLLLCQTAQIHDQQNDFISRGRAALRFHNLPQLECRSKVILLNKPCIDQLPLLRGILELDLFIAVLERSIL